MPHTRRFTDLAAALCFLVSASAAFAQGPEAPKWTEVRSVLERNCLKCHGGETVKSEFRLANAETFKVGGSRGAVINARESEASRLLSVIRYDDPDLAMPPTGKLPAKDLQILEAWVKAGAPWPQGEEGRLADPGKFRHEKALDREKLLDHWAYRPLAAGKIPRSSEKVWNQHPVDAFIRSGLDEAALRPAPLASPRVLIRRASYDLIGLPPRPEEVAAFVKEVEAEGLDAPWSRLIDRLLASPHYGEHWARHWLDLVRYAETNGYERDAKKKNIWRYRDWVIRALNRDLPYDRFVVEQLAGDELPKAAASAHIATGYYRLGVWDDEPADRRQARADEIADIVDTTGQVFLATTVGCARCHDHKADPFSQREYYELTAWFNNLKGMGSSNVMIADPPGPGQITTAERARLVAQVDEKLAPVLQELREKLASDPKASAGAAIISDARSPSPTNRWRYLTGEAPDGWANQDFDDREWKEGAGGFGQKGTPGAVIGTTWNTGRIQLRRRFRLTEIPRALVLTVHHDEDLELFINGRRVFVRPGYLTEYREFQLPPEAAEALVVGSNVLGVMCHQTGGGQYIDVGLRSGWLGDGDAVLRQRLEVEGANWLSKARWREGVDRLVERKRREGMPAAEPYAMAAAAERGREAPRQHILLRGSAHASGDRVQPRIAEAFLRAGKASSPTLGEPPSSLSSTGRRLIFARFLVNEGRVLTARVMANRLWQFHFGRGLSRSPGDFGRLGEAPTHPELLDHLARTFIDEKWSLKAMHRYLMNSRTYRMASEGDPDAARRDARNDRYWRFDPRRLRAEEYRDAVLAVSGDLNLAQFGPSVFPPMPAEVLATSSTPNSVWGRSSAENSSRRSIYVHVKRSLRLPLLESLDQPDPDLPCAARFPTNVPTQALITLNGDFTNRAADRLALRLQKERSTLDERIEFAIELTMSRSPSEKERDRFRRFIESMKSRHGFDDHEALRVFCLGLFNLNEFLWID